MRDLKRITEIYLLGPEVTGSLIPSAPSSASPSFLGNFTALVALSLVSTNITGTLPSDIFDRLTNLQMADTKPEVEKEDDDKGEVLGNLVKVVVLIWSASLLTFSYVRLPNGNKILDFDPTFIASVFSGSLAAFGLSPAKAGGGNGSAKKKRDEEPPVVSAIDKPKQP